MYIISANMCPIRNRVNKFSIRRQMKCRFQDLGLEFVVEPKPCSFYETSPKGQKGPFQIGLNPVGHITCIVSIQSSNPCLPGSSHWIYFQWLNYLHNLFIDFLNLIFVLNATISTAQRNL